MTLKELLNVLEPTFIAVGYNDGKNISYSGNSKDCNTYFLMNRTVTKIAVCKRESSATVIYVD